MSIEAPAQKGDARWLNPTTVTISHELEAQMRDMKAQATEQSADAVASFRSDRGFLTAMVWTFSVASIVFALLVGIVLSWAFVRPLRRIEGAVAGLAAGDFSPRVEVRNRDEFGTLGANVNRMTMRLGNLYTDIQDELAERKRTEQELQGRAVELVAMNNELESMSYSLSQDVWAPMREIDTAGRELAERYGERLGEEGRKELVRVRGATSQMRGLIDEMVNMSRVLSLGAGDGQDTPRERVDLSALARSVADDLRERNPGRTVELVIHEGIVADGDPRRLRVALEDLLGNAWKFTARQPKATISFGSVDRGGETVYFVGDDGAGFDMADAGSLFGPFQRLSGAAEYEGVGVGLATVKRVVDAHGGRIWAEAAVDEGAIFYFTLA